MSGAAKPDYGIDAPGVVRNLFLVAATAGVIRAPTITGAWSGILQFRIAGASVFLPLGQMAPWLFVSGHALIADIATAGNTPRHSPHTAAATCVTCSPPWERS